MVGAAAEAKSSVCGYCQPMQKRSSRQTEGVRQDAALRELLGRSRASRPTSMRDRFRRLRVGLKMIRVAGRKGFASHGPVDSFRFGVGNPSGRRSSAYTIFRNGTDVYLTPYGTRHILKVSLHASGDWRVAITKEHLTRRDAVPIASARNRTLLSWRRPYEVADGYLNAFSIHIPGAELRKLGAPPNKQKDIRWHPDPGDDRVVTFLIVFLPPWELADWWPGFGERTSHQLAG